jgi:hypothetical protein
LHKNGEVRESAAELAASFATLGVASRLTSLERGKSTRFEL